MTTNDGMIEGLRTLFAEAPTELPVAGLGFVYEDDEPGLVFVYIDGTGLSVYRGDDQEVSKPFHPGREPAYFSEADLVAKAAGLIESRAANVSDPPGLLAEYQARRLFTAPIPGQRAATFIVGLKDAALASDAEREAVRALAERSAHCFDETPAADADLAVLRRLDDAERQLPRLFQVLDVREIFDRLSESTRDVLPHDLASLALFRDDLTAVEMYAQTVESPTASVRPVPYPPIQTSTWLARFIDDVRADHFERVSAAAGGRAALRVAIRLEGRTIGALSFTSFSAARYRAADLRVANRVADYVALALSHFRLAEESRRTAALRERAANLEMLDGLLNTLTVVLDVRQVFDRVSAIAQKVLPHDALSVAEMLGTGERVRVHASHGLGDLPEPFDIDMPDLRLVTEPWDYRIIEDLQVESGWGESPARAAGMRSMLLLSIRFEGRLFGGLNFYSKAKGRFTHQDVLVARRITDHVALALSHRRLAEQARQNEELRARTTTVELLEELLGTLIDSGSIPDVFGRMSTIAQKVLAHDALSLMVRQPDGIHAELYATSGFGVPPGGITNIPDEILQDLGWEYHLFERLRELSADPYRRLVAMGFESLLRVPIRLDGQFAGALVFVSKHEAAFKPTDVLVARRIADRLAATLARDRELQASRRADEAAARAARLEARVTALTEELDNRTGYRRVVGESRQWRTVLTQATQVAATDTTVLLLGESGTGKEVVARFLHRASGRSKGPFVALNCAALPEQLLEAELFGYERGAYTGATQSKPGQLEQAAGGTLFLDEVGEMSLSAQAKFLRVLQEKEFQRLGGTRVLRTDARIVAATNRDLKRAIAQGQFREDLYYRLNVFAIELPPLRARRDDILPLSEAFLAEIGRGIGRPPSGISRDARQRLTEYAWPGNVRELRNILERAAILCEGGLITAEHLTLTAVPSRPPVAELEAVASAPRGQAAAAADAAPQRPASRADLQSLERRMIEEALQTARYNKSKAAKALGLTRQQLYVRMRKYGLE